jgi:hypothetical protein
MRSSLTLLLVSLLLFFQSVSAVAQNNTSGPGAEKRLALVIGNAKYIHSPELANPVNDARSIRDALQNVGFEVYEYENLNQAQIKQAIDLFGNKLKLYNIGLFYYSGHGIQSKGANYLIPVDANIQSEQQIEYDCVQADRVLGFMEAAGSEINIVILDACRNNPFERSWSRAVDGSGLAFMNAPTGSLIAYSTSPGRTASDGSGSNGLYTSSLLENIKTPGITILQMFQNVRRTVSEKSDRQQIPWESTSLTNDFYFVSKNISPVTNKLNATWKRVDEGYFFYINNEEIGSRLSQAWSENDLLVYDPVTNATCLLENYNNSSKNRVLPAIILDNSTNTFYRVKDGLYYLYVKGEQIASRTSGTFVDEDVLVYDGQTNITYILKGFKTSNDNKLRPAVIFDNAESAFWRREKDNSYWFYVKGKNIQENTKGVILGNDCVVYDQQTNITYIFKDFLTETDRLRLRPAQIVSYQDNVFWQKTGNLFYLIVKGEMIQDRTSNTWSGKDLYVTDKQTNVIYILSDFANAPENQLRPALINPGN